MMFKLGSLTPPCSHALTVYGLCGSQMASYGAWGFCLVFINMSLARTLFPFLSPRTRAQIACHFLRTTSLGHGILVVICTKHLSICLPITHLLIMCLKGGNLLVPSQTRIVLLYQLRMASCLVELIRSIPIEILESGLSQYALYNQCYLTQYWNISQQGQRKKYEL